MSAVEAPRYYSLRQAVELTGYSAGKFRYNKEKLIAAGVEVTTAGWKIPHAALVSVGWLNKGTNTKPVTLTPLQLAELRIAELEKEIAELRGKRSIFGRRK